MFSSLSETQKEIVFNKSGKFVVRACPGSGKTYSVAARAAHRIHNLKNKQGGIALLSFTNVAWQEIRNKLENNFNIFTSTKYPHFLGTLDSFVNQYIFLPFGHLVMGCKTRPLLVGEPHNSWSYCPYEKCYEQYFDIVSYDIDNSLIYPEIQSIFFFGYSSIYKQNGTESQHAANLRTMKQRYWKEGYANQRDANYFAVKILEKYPSIAKALVARFPELIVDEAQDTTEVQMRLIDLLIENGLNEVMLIGDSDQAIFEWNRAKPELFSEKYNAWKENSIVFNENRRSSQLICDFTAQLTSMPTAPVAINDEVKNCDYPIEIVAYDHTNSDSVNSIIQAFVNKCKQHSINTTPETVSVLFRSKDFVNIISNVSSHTIRTQAPWISGDAITRDITKAKYFIDKHHYREGYKLLEKVFIKAKQNIKQCRDDDLQDRIDEVGIIQHRKDVFKIAHLLPSTEDVGIKDWVADANRALKDFGIKLKINDQESKSVNNLFQRDIPVVSDYYRLGTVHSVKGETFDAVLLLLKKKGASGSHYKTLLNNQTKTEQSEELRIVYVAMTRPRKFLMIAVNDNDLTCWEKLNC